MVRGQVSQKNWRESHRDKIRENTKRNYVNHKDRYKKNIIDRQRLIKNTVASIGPSNDPESLFYRAEIVR